MPAFRASHVIAVLAAYGVGLPACGEEPRASHTKVAPSGGSSGSGGPDGAGAGGSNAGGEESGSGARGSGAGDSGTGDSGTGDSGTGDSGTGDSGTGDSGSVDSGATGGAGGSSPSSKFVGNITTSNAVRSDFLDYWNQLTPENEGKWGSVEATRDGMSWSKLDEYYRFTRENGIPLKQHTFVWGRQAPSWIDALSTNEQTAEIEEWIRLFCERYPDVELIDVVNEPDHAKPDGNEGRASFHAALGGDGTTGHDWVIRAFQLAREHCPNATLILNDYNVLRWDTDAFVSIANKVKNAAHVGGRSLLDAIGCQAHGLETQPLTGAANGGSLTANLNKIIAIGVPIYISEYDVDLADDAAQLSVMQQQFPLFHETPQIAGITLWGYVYGDTWLEHSGLVRDGQPRPAMTWLMSYLGR